MTDEATFYPAEDMRRRARILDEVAKKHPPNSVQRNARMEAWALRLAADVVAASERACRAGFVNLGFTGHVSDADMAELMGLNIAAMRLELAAREQEKN